MVDHIDEDLPPPPSVFPPKAPREAVIIEGEAHELPVIPPEAEIAPESAAAPAPAAAIHDDGSQESPAAPESPAPEIVAAPPTKAAPSRAAPFGFGLGGAVIGAAAALAAAWAFDPRAASFSELVARTDAVQSSALAEAQGRKAFESRLAALETVSGANVKASDLKTLDQRLARLEAAPVVTPAALAAVQAEARAARDAAAKALTEGSMKAPPASATTDANARPSVDLSAIEARIARLEAAPAPAPAVAAAAPAADPRIGKVEAAQQHSDQALASLQASLDGRLAKLEAALAPAKAETRVSPDEAPPRPDVAAQGVAALALEQRLVSGQAFGPELAALARLGADPSALAALKPFAESGAPSASTLSAAFARIMPSALAAAEPVAPGGILDKLAAEAGKMVKVHPAGEVSGDDPPALATRIQLALARGQFDAAFGLWKKWPEAARKASADWGRSVEGRAGADAAAKTLRESALARLAPTKN